MSFCNVSQKLHHGNFRLRKIQSRIIYHCYFFSFSGWIAIHVEEMDSLRCTDLVHARAQKLPLPGEFRGNFRFNHGTRDVWLSNSVFSAFFRLFDRNLALLAYFNCIFHQSHVILWNHFRAIFRRFVLICFHFVCTYHIVSITASEENFTPSSELRRHFSQIK